MSKIRTGLVGCGNISRNHAEALATLPESEFVAICDVQLDRAKALAEEYNVPQVYDSLSEMLGKSGVEMICVCTPHPLHPAIVIDAAKAGVHAIVEKPICTTLKDADAMIEAHDKAGTTLGTIFQRRWWPGAQRLRRVIDEGKMGKIILGDVMVKWSRDQAYYSRDAWRGKWATEGGGVMMNQAVHAIDMYQWYMGPIETIYGFADNLSHPYIEVEDNAVAALRFKNGAMGTLLTSVSQHPTLFSRISVHGDNGSSASVLEQPEGSIGINDIWHVPGEPPPPAEEVVGMPYGRVFHKLQIQDFLQAIQEKRKPLVDGREGRKSLAIMHAIYESCKTGRPVRMSDLE